MSLFREKPVARLVGERRHLELTHGPIHLIVGAFGTPDNVALAHDVAKTRFQTILGELASELDLLRQPAPVEETRFDGSIARRMAAAVNAHAAAGFVTPMASVAGAVADEMVCTITAHAALDRLFVNNGGDIALHLQPGQQFQTAMAVLGDPPKAAGFVTVSAGDGIGGMATSGRHGRSFSQGIADSVTVLAATSAEADVAATLIANAVDLPGHAGIVRKPACELAPDSDLGQRPVVTGVAPLTADEARKALGHGQLCAKSMVTRGAITAAALCLCDQTVLVGHWPQMSTAERRRFSKLCDSDASTRIPKSPPSGLTRGSRGHTLPVLLRTRPTGPARARQSVTPPNLQRV